MTHKNKVLNKEINEVKNESELQKNKMQNIIDDLEKKMNKLKNDNTNAYMKIENLEKEKMI